jgi:hypothetical protein
MGYASVTVEEGGKVYRSPTRAAPTSRRTSLAVDDIFERITELGSTFLSDAMMDVNRAIKDVAQATYRGAPRVFRDKEAAARIRETLERAAKERGNRAGPVWSEAPNPSGGPDDHRLTGPPAGTFRRVAELLLRGPFCVAVAPAPGDTAFVSSRASLCVTTGTANPAPLPQDGRQTSAVPEGEEVGAWYAEANPAVNDSRPVLTALGVVYGASVRARSTRSRRRSPSYGLAVNVENVNGLLSLISWVLVLIVSEVRRVYPRRQPR